MTRPVRGILENTLFEPISNGTYRIPKASYTCLTDAGGGIHDLKSGFLVYVPTRDAATNTPILGEVSRFLVKDVQIESPNEVSIWIEYDGYKTEPDPPANGLPCVICEATQYGVGIPVSEDIYTDLPVGMAIAILAEDMRRLIQASNGTSEAPKTETPTWSSNMDLSTTSKDLLHITLEGPNTTLNFQEGKDGQKLMLELKQGTGNNSVTWGSKVTFGNDIQSVVLSTEINKIDYVGLIYSNPASTWRIIAYSRGY